VRRAATIALALGTVLASAAPGDAQPPVPGVTPWHWRYTFAAGAGRTLGGHDPEAVAVALPELSLLFARTPGRAVGVVAGLPWSSDAVAEKPRAEAGLRYERAAGPRLRVAATGGALLSLESNDARRPAANAADPFGEIRLIADGRISMAVRVERARDAVVPYVLIGTAGWPGVGATALALAVTAWSAAQGN